ncbi:MAG TPA: lipoprotein-releasing ABC transporter permease subunit [Steroidobacteraceae bacterium]|nr:lipoprotein-releasing ABC transporter permease subunit [Steroidobacteraceae bacterium]
MARYELLVGGRYLRSARGNRFVSFISTISMAGIAIGVAVLIVVLSVMNGYEKELRERIVSWTAHATISGFSRSFENWRDIATLARTHAEVSAIAPFVEGQAMLVSSGRNSSAEIYGVLPKEERNVSKIHEHMVDGRFDALQPDGFGVVLGDELAKALNVRVGDHVVLVVPQATVTIAGVTPRLKRCKVVGIFRAGMYEYDRNFAYLNMDDAARLYRMGSDVTGVRLQLHNLLDAPRVARQIGEELGVGAYVEDWTHRHANLFQAIALQKRLFFFILLLVVAVAASNIVSTLVMVVKDKQSDIAILRTFGATPRSVLEIFITQGTGIGVLGVVGGIALGALLSMNLEALIHLLERALNTHFLDAKVYLMSDLPALVEWPDVTIIGATAFGLCCLSTLYPAWRASRTQPAQALRHD